MEFLFNPYQSEKVCEWPRLLIKIASHRLTWWIRAEHFCRYSQKFFPIECTAAEIFITLQTIRPEAFRIFQLFAAPAQLVALIRLQCATKVSKFTIVIQSPLET